MEIKGLNSVISDIRKFGKEAERDIAYATEQIADKIVKYAAIAAPANYGKLGQSIRKEKINPTLYKITAHAPYAAFMEFGTGTKIKIPDELKSVAAQFKGQNNGNFKTALKDIKDWCRRKGIPESAAYPILAKILRVGITPKPFLYPSLLRGRFEYLENLKKVLNAKSK